MIVYLNGEPMAEDGARGLLPDRDHVCALHRDHGSARPLRLVAHHVWPRGHGGPTTPGNLELLCGSGHDAVHELLRRMLRGEPLPRYFGTRTERAMAGRGYEAIRLAVSSSTPTGRASPS